MILKYKLIQGDSLKTTPLLMYEKLYGKKLKKGLLFDHLAGEPVLNSFILDYKIRPLNILDREKYNIVYLGELLTLPPPVIREMLKDRIVLLGDYEDRDLHYTVYGYMPGTLILLNAFLALENGDNQISWGFIFFIFIGYTLISVKAFIVRDPLTKMIEQKLGSDSFAVELMLDMTFFLVFLGIMSLISYFVFNIHLAILFLSFYLYALELIFDFIIQRKAKNKNTPVI